MKRNLKYRRGKTLDEAYLSIMLETAIGDLEIISGCQPPRRDYLPIHPLIEAFNKPHPVILMGDLNARTAVCGYRTYNGIRRSLNTFKERGITKRIGPNFPTFFTATTATKPDIILTSNIIPYNYHIIQGPPTVSDYAPMIMAISRNPIQIETPQRKNFQKANWNKYKESLTRHEQQKQETIKQIDEKLESLLTAIINVDKETIPTTHYKNLPYPPNTEESKNKIEELK